MKGFKKFTEGAPLGDDYWSNRLAQFQAAQQGQKGAIGDNRPPVTTKSQERLTTTTPESKMRVLRPEEVKALGLHPNHHLVWRGSTADAPRVYPYVFVVRLHKYMTNPHYQG